MSEGFPMLTRAEHAWAQYLAERQDVVELSRVVERRSAFLAGWKAALEKVAELNAQEKP